MAQRNDYRPALRSTAQGPRSNFSQMSRNPLSIISNNSYAHGNASQFQKSTSRPTDRVHKHEEYEVGVIFSVGIHEHDDDQKFRPQLKPDQSQTKNHGIVNSKYRKHIVIAIHTDRVTAVPIYTYMGRGCKGKVNADEHVSIRDFALKGFEAAAETKHGKLWAMTQPRFLDVGNPGWHMMSNVTSVLFTAPYSHKTSRKVTISGKLTGESVEALLDLYQKAQLGNRATTTPTPKPIDLNQDSNMAGSSVVSIPTPKASVVGTPVKLPSAFIPPVPLPATPPSAPRAMQPARSSYASVTGSTYRTQR
ncbi:hypothetical protein B0J14DRAFT_697500 [Halenospora varia]|nr:hypothetical protein B0J14DRAFT_697500 [Halenospora varia]